MYEKQIVYVRDLIKDEGGLMSPIELRRKYNLNINIMYIFSLISALPIEWKNLLKQNRRTPEIVIEPILRTSFYNAKVSKLNSKLLYKYFVREKQQVPSCISRWAKDGINLEFDQFQNIFVKTKYLTKDTKDSITNYKIMHKNYATRYLVSKFDSEVNSQCEQCSENYDIIHTFVTCKKIELFWKLLQSFINNNIVDEPFVLTPRLKLLGTLSLDNLSNNEYIVDFVLLQARLFIHRCNVNDQSVFFSEFLHILKSKINIEMLISKHNIVTFESIQLLYNTL